MNKQRKENNKTNKRKLNESEETKEEPKMNEVVEEKKKEIVETEEEEEMNIVEKIEQAMKFVVPDQSKGVYEKAFRHYEEWCELAEVSGDDGQVLAAYFMD